MRFSQYTTRHLREFLGIILLILISFSPVWAIEKPTKSQLESYTKDGSLNWRIRNALSFDNHIVSPDLARSFGRQLDCLRLAKSGKIDTEIDRILASVSASPAPLRSKGTNRVFALLISFPDYPANQSPESVASKLFGDGEGNWPYESLRNYYRRSSYNMLDIEGNVLGWYTPSYTRAGMPQTPEARESLIKEALFYYCNQGHDFSQYDNDGDGSIDYFMVIWTGPDNGWGGFWWGYHTSISDRHLAFSGKGLSQTRYSWLRDSGPDTLAFDPKAAIHETGHALGLPDYYDYVDQTGPRDGIGSLDMMDGECGDHNPFSKMLLGWIDPQVFDLGKGEFILRASGNSQDALLIVPDPSSAETLDEFYLVQNRFRTENDFYLPGDGLLIWHVDARVAGDGHFLNNNSSTDRKLLSLIEGGDIGHIQEGHPADSADYFVTGKSIKLNLDPSPSAAIPDISIYGIGPSGPVQFFRVDIQNPFSPQRSTTIQRSGSGNNNSKVTVGNQASGSGTTYYVDAINGSDANNGLTPEKAWKTINKVNNSIFMQGDSILFKRGETWREQLTVPTSGSAGSPIVFGAYGTGPKPIINGTDLVVTWEPYAGYTNVWKAVFTTEPSQVYFNLTRGTKVTSASLCDAATKWYWTSNVLYVYSASDPDTVYVTPGIEAARRTQTILVDGKTHITLENLDCQKSAASTAGSIYFINSNPAILDNLDLTNNDAYAGIYIRGTGNSSLIKNCSVSFTRHTTADRGVGILIDGIGRGHIVQDCKISHNTASGIKEKLITASDSLTIQRNTVYQNGAAGISINGDGSNPDGCIIQNNIVYSNGQTIYDYWGIDLFKVGDNNVVRYNIVHDHHYISVSSGGIRFDAQPGGVFGSNNQISYNLIYNERCGIEIGGASAFTVYNNSIYNSSEVGLAITAAETTSGTIKNNILHTAGSNIIQNFDATNVVFNNNCYFPVSDFFRWNASTTNFATWKTNCSGDANSINANPAMTDPANGNFSLQVTSPCIDAGVDVGLTQDYEGNSIRGLPDIGAFEFSGVTSSLTASATSSPTAGQAPLTVNFTGNATGGTSPYSYSWNFGDGQSSSLQNPSHIFSSAGTYNVVLRVTDSKNATDTESLTIVVTSSGDTVYVLSISSATGSPAPGQGGTTEPAPGNYSYTAGSNIEVKSVANADYRFSRWLGDIAKPAMFNTQTTVTMDKNKTLSGSFCAKCGDVNGDLKITPADAQKAFDIYLKRIQYPTKCELENADVNCSGTPTDPKITPADAQAIFNKFLEKADLPPGDCSGIVRTGTSASAESLGISQTGDVHLVIDEMEASLGKDILIPILADSSFPISAFGFDLAFPSDILVFIGIEGTDYTERIDQIGANTISEGVVRVGGYATQPVTTPSPAALVTLVFRVITEVQVPTSFSIINTYDDLRQAQIRNGIIRWQVETSQEEIPWLRRTGGKRHDF